MEGNNKQAAYRTETVLFLCYFVLYVLYLFFRLETEFEHWLTLVILPLAIVYFLRRRQGFPAIDSLGSIGIRKDNWRTGLIWACSIGLGLSVLQLLVSNRANALWDLITSGKALYAVPLVFVLLLFTAGFTEEFFFRGILQTRIGDLLRSRILAVLATSLLFGLYHFPYAYLNPSWPSHGNITAALAASMGQGIAGGLILGTVFERSRRNLFAGVLVHSLLNTLPAATMIKFGGV